jgi:hypothetical protein
MKSFVGSKFLAAFILIFPLVFTPQTKAVPACADLLGGAQCRRVVTWVSLAAFTFSLVGCGSQPKISRRDLQLAMQTYRPLPQNKALVLDKIKRKFFNDSGENTISQAQQTAMQKCQVQTAVAEACMLLIVNSSAVTNINSMIENK